MPYRQRLRARAIVFILVLCLAYPFTVKAQELALPPVEKFILAWEQSGGMEIASSQPFIEGLCEILGVEKPKPHRPTLSDNGYSYEYPVTFLRSGKKSTGRIDLYKRGCFLWESKQGSNQATPEETSHRRTGTAVRGTKSWDTVMVKAKAQAEEYIRCLSASEGRPPFLIVSDIGHVIEVYADFKGTGMYTPFPSPQDNRIMLADLRREDIRERLKTIWTDPLSLDPSRENEKVTQDIVVQLSVLAASLEAAGHNPDTTCLFLYRCIFTMFAEDCGLLPRDSFTTLLTEIKHTPEKFAPAMTEIWATMWSGGECLLLGGRVPRFQGVIFSDAKGIELTEEQTGLLLKAANANWAAVDTSIFGSLLNQALSAPERHKVGARYTPTAYVERLVVPTILEPERVVWEQAKNAAVEKVLQGKTLEAIAEIEAYYSRLASLRVLDPSCGSGSFLAVSLIMLKELEGEVVQALRLLGLSDREIQQKGYHIGPQQMRGIEPVQRAADISELVLWIAYLQHHYRIHGNFNPPEPILPKTRSIECRDAVIAFDEAEKPSPAPAWPETDYIVGNPPFMGNQRMRELLGDKYTEALREAYPELPDGTEYVLYWWHRAATLVREGKVQRFGLITTSSLAQTMNRRVVERHLTATPPLSIVWAVPNHPWQSPESPAQVRIAMTVGAIGRQQGILAKIILEDKETRAVYLDEEKSFINADLSIGVDVTQVPKLRANALISHVGVMPHGKGFTITKDYAVKLGLGSIPGLEKHIRPYLNGRDLAESSRDVMIIDLHGLTLTEVQKRYPKVYRHLLETVKPVRDGNREEYRRNNWWLFGRKNTNLRASLTGLKRYIATVKTSRWRYFVFLDVNVIPDSKLIVFASDDAYTLGVLSSRFHQEWILATCGRQGVGNDPVYVKSISFDSFPFPDASDEQKARIREIAETIDAHRKDYQTKTPWLPLSDMYSTLEQMYYGANLTPKEREISEHGDLSTLLKLHADLDAAVAEAYGWSRDLPTPELISRLLELNKTRVEEEKAGTVRWLRPELHSKKS